MEGVDECTCDCYHGYEGKKCTKPVDWCQSQPCLHNTRCDSVGRGANSSYICECKFSGYKGRNCDEDEDDCASEPCMNGGVCSDHGRHSFKCDCPKATKNTTGYTDSICQTPVYFKFSGELNVDGDDASVNSTLAADENWEFIGLAAALLVLLLVLVFFVLRYHLRGKERVLIHENGEAYILNETTGTTKRANFDVDVVGQSISVAGPTINTSAGHIKTRRQITMVHGSGIRSAVSPRSHNSNMSNVTFTMPGGVYIDGDESSSTLSSSSDEEDRLERLERLNNRRTSEMMLKEAFGDYSVNIDADRVYSDAVIVNSSTSSGSELLRLDDFDNLL